MDALSLGALLAPALLVVLVVYLLASLIRKNKEILKERGDSTRRIYELAILKELGERAGYSLNVEEILQIITGSLRQFIDYTAVGFVVITPEKIKINTHVEKSVSHTFLKDMKDRMLASLSALTAKEYDVKMIDEVVSGALLIDEIKEKIGSFFNIPLVIGGSVAGVLTVAHVDVGLYKEEDMTILYKITGQASEAVTRLQEVVKMEQGKLNAMVESMGDGVLMVDPEYRVVVANPAIKKTINFANDKAITIFDFVDALGGKFDIHGRLEEAVAKKTSYVSEKISIDESFFEIGVYPVTHSSLKGASQVLGAVVVFHDITRDIELEQVREEFTSMIVHELRSPLDGIKKITELLVGGSNLSQDQSKEYLNMAHQSTSSMLELVNDILDLSKLQAGKFEVNKEKANIKEVIENRIAFYKISADARKVSLETFLHEGLPNLVDFDPQAIKQILNNFISNALKFTSANGKIFISAFTCDTKDAFPKDLKQKIDDLKIPVFVSPEDLKINQNSLCVVVSDTGIGIREADLPQLFHTFKQAKLSPVDKETKGTGLGLVIAKGIAEAHQGTVGAVSKEGSGTSFFFTIPI